jgi:two-component sensor histidine kinase
MYSVALDPDPSSVGVARLMLRAALWDWQIDHLADTAQLIMSELASNAIKFAKNAEALVYLRDRDDGSTGATLAIEVIDDSLELPRIVQAGPDDESHRGLVLVDALSSKWGAELLDSGKSVWVHIEYDEPDESAE